jgi:hypothetical protein
VIANFVVVSLEDGVAWEELIMLEKERKKSTKKSTVSDGVPEATLNSFFRLLY